MDIEQIRNFLKLSKELHFWRTAEMIHISQSALTRQIQALEQEMGIQLFERNKRNVKLTAAGVFLRDKWSVLLDDLSYVHLFARKMSHGEIGKLRIVHPDSISSSLIPEVMLSISQKHPELTIELLQLPYANTQQSLLDYKIDLAFTRQESILPDISSKKIKSEPVAFFIPKDHAFMVYSDLSAESLIKQRFILPVAESQSSFHGLVQEIFRSYGFIPEALYESDFGSSILGLVSKGLGIAILPMSFAQNGTPGIRVIQLPFTTELYISWRTDDNGPALNNVLKIIADLCLEKTLNFSNTCSFLI
ncbi:MAG: LysR substrate-binding domain-containing protein [Dyadobacter sp.]